MYRIISCKSLSRDKGLSHDKVLEVPAIQKFLPFGINMSFCTDMSESSLLFLLCHSQEILDGVRSLPLEDGPFCQPGTSRPTISSTLCQISVFKIGLKCR